MNKITTVIPTYRRSGLLRRAILSVLAQDYRELEVCVFDDASNDDTAAVVSEIASRDPRVKYHYQGRNLGMMPNTASALSSVDSEFFTILNDDDFLAPGFFTAAHESLIAHPEAGAFVGRLIYWNGAHPRKTMGFPGLPEGYYKQPDAFFQVLQGDQHHTW